MLKFSLTRFWQNARNPIGTSVASALLLLTRIKRCDTHGPAGQRLLHNLGRDHVESPGNLWPELRSQSQRRCWATTNGVSYYGTIEFRAE